MLMELTGGQRDRIQRLLEEELRTACRSAIDSGARTADIRDLLTGRRHAMDDLLLDLADDAQHPVDDPGDGDGIVEQRG